MKQLLLILNPTSGTRKAAKHLPEILSVFNRADYDTHVYVTAGRGDAIQAVQRLGPSADRIVCCGGDGTLNETVTGMIEAGMDIPIGYIPSGSTNDFANSLHLSPDVTEAARQIVNGVPTAYDVGTFGDRYFTYIASFGAFTKSSYATPQAVKNAIGRKAYILEGIQELSGIRKESVRIEMDGETVEDDFLFGAVCNCTCVGGILKLKPETVDMADGKFEVLLIRAPKDIKELQECFTAVQNQTYRCRMITFRSAGSMRIFSSPDMVWSLDGERADGAAQIGIENLHRRFTLLH